MADSAELEALIAKYPTLRKPFETGIESHDGREQALLSFIRAHPAHDEMRGNPLKILEAMDDFSYQRDFLISVGPHKAGVLASLIAKERPTVLIELGGYLGYSAILFAHHMRNAIQRTSKEIHVWSLEMSAEFATIAEELIALAGLSDLVTVVVGPAEVSLRRLKAESKVTACDMLFLDHVETLYVDDFKVCEDLGFLKEGTVIVADNVVRPGAPEYRTFVRSHEGLESEGVLGLIQPGDGEDELEVSHVTGPIGKTV